MRKIVFIFVVLVAISTSVTAQQVEPSQLNQDMLETYKTEFNEIDEELPGFLDALIGDQRINAIIHSNKSESVEIGVVMNGTKIARMENHTVENPTLEVEASMSAIEEIYESEDPAAVTREKIRQGEIEYRASGLLNRVQVFFVDIWAGL